MRILAVAPYPGLKKLLLEWADKDPEIDLEVETGDLEAGVKQAARAEENGFDLVISRGGTAQLIQEAISLPVIEIPITGYDMLRVLTLVKDYQGDAAIVGFPAITRGAVTVRDLLGLDLKSYTIHDPGEVRQVLTQLRQAGVRAVLGDVVTVRTAGEEGLHGILITSGKEAVSDAFREAKQTFQRIRHREEKLRLLQSILDREERGILITDHQGRTIYANYRLKKWLDMTERGAEDVAAWLWREHPFLKDRRIVHGITLPSERSVVVQSEEVDGFVVHTFQESAYPEGQGIKIKRSGFAAFSRIEGRSGSIRQAVEQARVAASTSTPVWLTGEKGTGKTRFAEAIHLASGRRGPLITVDGARMEQILVDREIDVAQGGTLHVERADQLSAGIRERLLSDTAEDNGPRLIFSSSYRAADMKGSSYIFIHLPPLRERIEDLDDLCRLWIAQFNSKYGKQVVGLEPELLELFKRERWPGNLPQLAATLEGLVREANTPFLSVDQGRKQLNQSMGFTQGISECNNFLSGTLEEIEERIIRQVLEEEGDNRTKAAKRLGINRSTLWRKLNRK